RRDWKILHRPRLGAAESWKMIPRAGPDSGLGFTISAPGRPRLGLELVFDDLSIQRAATDVEHARRLFLVPVHRLEDADDVRALGIGERGQMIARDADGRRRGVQKLDVGGADRSTGRGERRARDGAFELADVAGPVIADEEIERF